MQDYVGAHNQFLGMDQITREHAAAIQELTVWRYMDGRGEGPRGAPPQSARRSESNTTGEAPHENSLHSSLVDDRRHRRGGTFRDASAEPGVGEPGSKRRPLAPANVAPPGLHTIAYQEDIVPNYPGNVMAARADRLKGQSRREVERFVSAWLRGAAYASDPVNREAAVAILGHYGQTPEGAQSSIEGVTLDARPDRDHLIVPWNLRQEFGLTTPEGTVDKYFTTRLYDRVVHHVDDGDDD